jgi:uncharacterized protein (DUF983 family)
MNQRSTKPQAGGLPWALWALLVIMAAVVGGLAAAAVVHVASRWVSVAIPALIGLTVALASRRGWPPQAGEQGSAYAPAGLGGSSAADAGRSGANIRPDRPVASGMDPAEPHAVGQVHRISSPSAGGTPWWVAAEAAQPQAGQEATTVPATDLSSYLASALIAQCPRCGAFDLDIRRGTPSWTCRCESCGHAWTWQPGTAWPQVRVSPRRRTQHTRPATDTRYRQD